MKMEMRNPLVPSFGEAVSSFEVFRRYLCFYKISDARLEHLERELLFRHHTQPTKQTSLLNYFLK
jgi:hypothetical protein